MIDGQAADPFGPTVPPNWNAFSPIASAAASLPTIPGYDVLEILGRGGMGVVYKARQQGLGRLVAVKMVLSGELAAPQEVARFRLEGEAIARLRHPNVVQIHDVGEYEGKPYFSMEFAEGGSLARQLEGTPLPPDEAARIIETLAAGVQAAHEAGIIHRDLKPGNILLLSDGTPKITDFGLAKQLSDATGPTATDAVMGTPSYMAPEQASGGSKHVGPQADVYALGAILYELLTGRPPFKGATHVDTLLQVVSNDPVPPRHLQPGTPRDLETICLKCLEKEISKRYASAQELANDLRRFREGQPIRARPVSLPERTLKWVKRHRGVAWLLGGLAAVITFSMIGLTGLWLRSEKIAREEAAQRRQKEVQLVRMYVDTGVRLMDGGDLVGSLPWFEKALAEERRGPNREAAHQQRLAAVWYQSPQPLHVSTHDEKAGGFAEFSPDGRWFLTAGPGGTAQVWDARTKEPVCPAFGHGDGIRHASFSHDGRLVVTAGIIGAVRIWDAKTGHPVTPPMQQPAEAHFVAFSPDDRWIASAGNDGFVRLWNAKTAQLATEPLSHEPNTYVESVVFSPNGALLATSGRDRTARLWETATGKPVHKPFLHSGSVLLGGFSPDGAKLLTISGEEGKARVWDVKTGQLAGPPIRHPQGSVYRAAFSPDGRQIATTSEDRTARLWDAATGEPVAAPLEHQGALMKLVYSRDGQRLVTAGLDGLACVWDLPTGRRAAPPLRHNGKVNSVSLSPDGTQVLTSSMDGTSRLWNIENGRPVVRAMDLAGQFNCVSFSSDTRHVAVAGNDAAQVADLTGTGRSGKVFRHDDARTIRIVLSRDGRLCATFGVDGVTHIHDAHTGEEKTPSIRFQTGVSCASFAPDNRRIAFGLADGTTRIWSVADGAPALPPLQHSERPSHNYIKHVEFSPDGRLVVSAGDDGTARLWDAETGRPACPPLRHERSLRHAAFSRNGRRLVTASYDSTARVWDVPTGKPVTVPLRHVKEVQHAAFSEDGRHVVTASLDHTARVWDAETGQPLCAPLQHSDYVVYAAFSGDGQRILTSSWDGTARIWDVVDGQPLGPPLRHADKVQCAVFRNGDLQAVTVSHDFKVAIWEFPKSSRPSEEWRALAELLSGQRVDDDGGMQALSAKSLEAHWRKLRSSSER